MRNKALCSLMAAGLFAAVGACGTDIAYPVATTEDFTATLAGANEVPSVTTGATGTVLFAVAYDTMLSYRIDVVGIDSTTSSNIHAGAPGAVGPVIVPLFAGPAACKQNAGAPIAISSSSVGTPTTITTTAPHGLGAAGTIFLVRIAGHAGSTPSLNDEYTATVSGTSTFTVPVAVTVGGTGGTAQRFVLINVTSPRCRPGYTGFLAEGQFKASQLTGLPAGYGATPRQRLDSLLVLLRNGGAYVNVNNAVNSSGHIRGQIGPR